MSKLPENVIQFLEENQPEVASEGDITVNDAMEKWGLSRNGATGRLNALVKEGKLTKHNGKLPSGRLGNFYKIVS